MKRSILSKAILTAFGMITISSIAVAAPIGVDGEIVGVVESLQELAISVAWAVIPLLLVIKFISSLHKIAKRSDVDVLGFLFGKDFLRKSVKPPEKRVFIDGSHIAAFYEAGFLQGNDFLKDYPTLKQEREAIKDMVGRIKQSKMTNIQKQRATTLLDLSEETIQTLRELHQLGKVSSSNKLMVASKLSEVKAGLMAMVDSHTSMLASGFADIKIPDTFQKQERLEQLRIEGKRLLAKIESDPNFDSHEDKFRLGVIVEKRLDEVWDQYAAAKSSYFDDNQEGVFTITNSKTTTPDTIIDMIFDDIAGIYHDIGSGAKSTKKAHDLGDLLTSKSYFERR